MAGCHDGSIYCEAILQAGGASLDDVIEVGVLLTNPADFAGLNEEAGAVEGLVRRTSKILWPGRDSKAKRDFACP